MTGDRTATDLIGVLKEFCSAFERRDPDAVMRLVASDPALIVVTSEEAILRGPAELAAFLHRYRQGRPHIPGPGIVTTSARPGRWDGY